MTEDQIERLYERAMDKLDLQLTKGILTNEEYDAEVLALNEWAEDMYNTYNERI
jgi:hypothetical protein